MKNVKRQALWPGFLLTQSYFLCEVVKKFSLPHPVGGGVEFRQTAAGPTNQVWISVESNKTYRSKTRKKKALDS